MSGKHSWFLWAFVFVFLRFIFIGDINFLGDEPELLRLALMVKEKGIWPNHGLMGTKGFHYGPLALWFYMSLLALSQNIFVILFLKILITSSLELWGLVRMRRLFPDWPPICFLIPLMSPYFWIYSRMLWDNPFNIPLTLLLFTFVVSFCRQPGFWSLVGLSILGVACTMVHLMSLPFVITSAVVVCVFQRQWLWKRKPQTLLALGLGLLIFFPYLKHLLSSAVVSRGIKFEWSAAFLEGSLLGPRLLTSIGLEYFFGNDVPAHYLILVYGFALFCLGLALVYIRSLIKLIISYFRPNAEISNAPETTLFLKLFFLLNSAFCFYAKLSIHPHYFNASWVFFWVLICLGIRSLKWQRLKLVSYASALSSFLMILNMLVFLHIHSGTRSLHYGPTIANQVEIVKAIRESDFPILQIEHDPKLRHHYYNGFSVIDQLMGTRNLSSQGTKKIFVKYSTPDNPLDGKLILDTK